MTNIEELIEWKNYCDKNELEKMLKFESIVEILTYWDDVNPENNLSRKSAGSLLNEFNNLIQGIEVPDRDYFFSFEPLSKERDGIIEDVKGIFETLIYKVKVWLNKYNITQQFEYLRSIMVGNCFPIRKSFLLEKDIPTEIKLEYRGSGKTGTREKVRVGVSPEAVIIERSEASVLYKEGDQLWIGNQRRPFEFIKDNGKWFLRKFRDNGDILEECPIRNGVFLIARTSGAARNGVLHRNKPMPISVAFNNLKPVLMRDEYHVLGEGDFSLEEGIKEKGIVVSRINGVYELIKFRYGYYVRDTRDDGYMNINVRIGKSSSMSSATQTEFLMNFDSANWVSSDGKICFEFGTIYIK